MIWRATTAVLVLLLALAAWPAIRHLREAPPPSPPARHAALLPADGTALGTPDHVLDAALSHDGQRLAFVATAGGRVGLWVRALAESQATALAATDAATLPAWKHGDNVIAFFSGGRLRQVSLADGAVRDLAAAPSPAGVSWQTDGSLLFSPDANGPIVALRSGSTTALTTLAPGERGHRYPLALAPDDFLYLVERADGSRVIRRRRGGDDVELTRTASHGALVGDHLLYVRDGTLLAQRLDRETGARAGRAVPLAIDVGVSPTGHGFFAASAEAVLAAAASPPARVLTAIDLPGGSRTALSEPGDYWQVRAAPAGAAVAVTAVDPLLRTLDVFLVPFASPAETRRVSLGIGADRDPVWAPRGDRLVYRSMLGGRTTLLTRPLAPPAAPETTLLEGTSDDTPTDWRGDHLLLHARGSGTGLDIWLVDLGSGDRRAVVDAAFDQWDARWSPDGRSIAYVSNESGSAEVYVAAWPGLESRIRVTFAGGLRPQWDASGRNLFFMRLNGVWRSRRVADGSAFLPPESVIEVEGLQDFAVNFSGNRLFVVAGAGRAGGPAALLLNWQTLASAQAAATR
jgi:Tol biopolymer transport system component